MDATPTGLADSARCYTCLSSHQKLAAITYLMAIWAGVNPDPVALAQAATPYRSIPVRSLRGILGFTLLNYLVPSGTPPILLSISPSSRATGSSENMIVTGTGFLTGGSTITVAGLTLGENTDFSEDSSSQLTVFGTKLNAIAVGVYDVSYTNVNGTSTLHNALTVTNTAPTITSISPANRNFEDITPMVVNGTNFTNDGGETLKIGATDVSAATTFNSSIKLTVNGAVIEFIAPGTYGITYTNANGTFTLPNALTIT